jgi:hypothetical protein
MSKALHTALGAPDFRLGDLSIWVHGYQFPDATDMWDSNWLRITARFKGAGSSVTVSGSELDTVSFHALRIGLVAMRDTLVGEAVLASVEQAVKVQVKFTDTLGHIGCSVDLTPDHLHERHWFEFGGIDQSDLDALISQVDTILSRYPVKEAAERGV